MGNSARNNRDLTGAELHSLAIDLELDRAGDDQRHLFLWMRVHGKLRAGLVNVSNHRLAFAVDDLTRDSLEHGFGWNVTPVDLGGASHPRKLTSRRSGSVRAKRK